MNRCVNGDSHLHPNLFFEFLRLRRIVEIVIRAQKQNPPQKTQSLSPIETLISEFYFCQSTAVYLQKLCMMTEDYKQETKVVDLWVCVVTQL